MAEPISFGQGMASPFASAIQGYQLGMGMRQAEEKAAFDRQQRELQLQRQQQLNEAFQRIQDPNATGQDFRNAMMLSDKDTANILEKAFQMRSQEQNQAALKKMSPVLFALKVGKTDDAVNLLNQEIEANKNTGNTQVADALGRYVQILQTGGKDAADVVREAWMGEMSFIPGADQVIKNINDVAQAGRAEREGVQTLRQKTAEAEIKETESKFAERLQQLGLTKLNWEVKDLQSKINERVKRLNVDTQVAQANIAEKMSSINKNLTELPADARKLVNEAVTEAATLQQSADRFLNLANQLDAAGGGYGVFSSAKDMFNRTFGVQNGMSQLRQEYTRLRNSAAIKSLPPGPATDKDIEMVLRGFPSENADARTISQFLRGMAKLQEIDAGVANAKTDWLANNRGSLTRANTGFKAGNVNVAPGESFVDVTKRVVDEVSKKYEPRRAAPAPAATPVPAGGPRVQQPVPGTPLINSLLEKYGAQ